MKDKFKINDYLTLKLEKGKTVIYVKGKRFRQCNYLLLNIPINDIQRFEEIKSVDESIEKLDKYLEPHSDFYGELKRNDKIPPEVEFWGHCSNMQVWYENGYNTNLLHSNLAFPLLRKLNEVGDKKAEKVFKEEIAKRFKSDHFPVVQYLITEGYLNFLDDVELRVILDDNNFTNKIIKVIRNGEGKNVLARIAKISTILL